MGETAKVTGSSAAVDQQQGVDTEKGSDSDKTNKSQVKINGPVIDAFTQAGTTAMSLVHGGFMLPFAVSQYHGKVYQGQIAEAEKEEKSIEDYAKKAEAATDPKTKNDLYSRVLYFGRRRLTKPFSSDDAKLKWRLKVANWAIENQDYHIAYDLLVTTHAGVAGSMSGSPILYNIKDPAHEQAVIKLFSITTDQWITAADAKHQLGDLDASGSIIQKAFKVNVWKTKRIKAGVNNGRLGVYFQFGKEEQDNRALLMKKKDAYKQSTDQILAKYNKIDQEKLVGLLIESGAAMLGFLDIGNVISGKAMSDVSKNVDGIKELFKDHGLNKALVEDIKKREAELATIKPTTDANRRRIAALSKQIEHNRQAIEKIKILDQLRKEIKHLDIDDMIDKTQVKIVTSALNSLPLAYFEGNDEYNAIINYAYAEKQQGKVIDWILSKHPQGFRQALHYNIETDDVCYDRKLGKELDSCVDYYEMDPKDAPDLPFSKVFRKSNDADIVRLMKYIDKVKTYDLIPGGKIGMQGNFDNSRHIYVHTISDLRALTKSINKTFGVDELPTGIQKGILEVEKLENDENKEDDSHQRVLALNESLGRIDDYAKRMKGLENLLATTKNAATPNDIPSSADLRAFVDESLKDTDALIKSLEARKTYLENIIITKDNRWLGQPPDAEWKAIKWRKKEFKEVKEDLQKLYSARTGLKTFQANYVHDNKHMKVNADTIETFKLMHFDGILLAEARHARRLMEGECVMVDGIPILKKKGDPAGARDVSPIHSEMTLDMNPYEYFINSKRDLTGQSKTPKPVTITSEHIAAYHKRFSELRQRLSKVALARSVDAKIIVLKKQAETVNDNDWFSLKTVENFGRFLADSTFWDVDPKAYDDKDPFNFMAARYMQVRNEINQAHNNNDADKFFSAQVHFLQLEHASDHSFLDKVFKEAEFAYNLKVGVTVVTLSAFTAGIADKLMAPMLVRLAMTGRYGMAAARIAQPLIWNGTFVAGNRIYGGAFQDGWSGAWKGAKSIVQDPLGFGIETIKMALMMKFIGGTGRASHKLFNKLVGNKAQAYLQKMKIPIVENGVVRMPTGWQIAKEMFAYGTVRIARPTWMFGAEVGGFQLWEALDKTGLQLWHTGSIDPVGNLQHAFEWKQIKHGGQFIIGLRLGHVLSLPVTKPINNATEKWIYKKFETEFAEYNKFTEETIAAIRRFDPEKGDHEAFVKDMRSRLKKHRKFLDRFPKDITYVNEHKFFNEQLGKQLDYFETTYKATAPIFAKGNSYGVSAMVVSDKYKTKMDLELEVATGINYTFSNHRGPELVTALHESPSVNSLRVFDNGVIQAEITHPLTQQTHSVVFIPKGAVNGSHVTKMQATAASPKPKPKPDLKVIQGGGETTTTQTKPTPKTTTAQPKKIAK